MIIIYTILLHTVTFYIQLILLDFLVELLILFISCTEFKVNTPVPLAVLMYTYRNPTQNISFKHVMESHTFRILLRSHYT